MYSYKRMLFLYVFLLTIWTTNVFGGSTYMDVSSPSPVNLDWGDSTSVSLRVDCLNQWCNCVCQYKVDSSSWSSLGTINSESYSSFSVQVQAPSTNTQGSKQYVVQVYCQDSGFGCSSSDTNTLTRYITVSYPTSATWSAYQAQLEAQNSAYSAIQTAKSLISQASSTINAAQSKIAEASRLGADVGSTAQQSLNQANADFSSANSYVSSAESAYNSGNYQSASSSASQAQTLANSAKSKAESAKAQATSIIEEWTKLKTAAEGKIRQANSDIDTAKQRIEVAEKIVYNATILGLDTAKAKSLVDTARSKVKSAEDYYKDASSIFNTATNTQSFENAKNQAQSATNTAKEAESLASQAYQDLSYQVTIAGEAAKAISNANSEVSQMNEILTKLDYVIRSTEKYGVELAETKNVAETSKTNVDSAEDLLSQAKNRIASGSFTEATNLGNQARDKAAESRNRLDTIANKMSLSSQDALEKAFENAKQKVADAEGEVSSASSTYGVTAELVVTAQNYIGQAKNSLEEAKTHIDKVNTASGLSDLVKELDASFKALDETNKQATNAINDAKSAKLGLYKKVAGVGAAAAGAAGGGFLYYRWRKKKKQQKEKKHEEEEKPKEKKAKILSKLFKRKHKEHEKHEEKEEHKKEEKREEKEEKHEHKKSKFCGKCGHKIEGERKFCPKCGNKLR